MLVYIRVHVHICVHLHIYGCTYKNVYVHVYIYRCTHTFYTCTYIFKCARTQSRLLTQMVRHIFMVLHPTTSLGWTYIGYISPGHDHV